MPAKVVLPRVVLADQLTDLLEERILDRVYEPGEHLNIDGLTREFDVSSSPVREALTRLTGAGLVVSVSFAGFSVAPLPKRAWFEQLRDYRIVTEGWAAGVVARERPAASIERMAVALKRMSTQTIGRKARDFRSASRSDEAFHQAMLEGSGNGLLTNSVRALRPHLQHARLFDRVPQDIRPVVKEHSTLLDAINAGDAIAASTALRDHLVASWERYAAWSGPT